MSFSAIIEMIENLPHERAFTCSKCGLHAKAYILSMYATCAQCSTRLKLRGYAALGNEVEDVVDAVLKWIGSGTKMEAAMKRKDELERDDDAE